VAHRESPCAKIVLDHARELEQAKAIGDAAAILADALSELFLRPVEFSKKPLIAFRLFHRIEIFAEEVFDERQLERLGIRGVPNDSRDVAKAREAGGAPPPLADDDLELLAMAPDHHGLEQARPLQGCGEVT
jgi:hypothetical protein